MSAATPWTAPTVEPTTEVEVLASEWISDYDQAEHLRRARDWLVHLVPDAPAEKRIAALTHDIERMFPGGPALSPGTTGWDSPFYLYPHMLRSAEVVGVWLASLGPTASSVDVAEIRRLVGLHEVGGRNGADEVQAADSLSYLETLAGLTRDWVLDGTCSREQAADKLRYMTDRIRVRTARECAEPLLEWALAQLPPAGTTEERDMNTSVTIAGRSRMVTANGLRHHVLRYGADDARDLLILPGITSPAVTMDFLAVRIAELGYRVTVPDIRGRGQTDRAPSGQHRLTDYAADVAGLVERLDLRAPVVLGHSMGARIAAAHAVLHAPTEPGPLVLVDPPMSGPGRAPYPTSREAFLEQLHQARRGTDADEVAAFYPQWPRRELQLRAEVLASCDETAVLETHAGFESEDFLEYWQRLHGPAVLVRGGNSPVVPEVAVGELRTLRPDIENIAVPGTGHMIPWDDLDGFLDAVRPYLNAYRTQ